MSYSSHQNCQWCSQPIMTTRKTMNCAHLICDKCVLSDRSCQSCCPYCWYLYGAQFIDENKICPVCCSGINSGDPGFPCSHKHLHCSQCPPDGCVLCRFRELHPWKNSVYRDLPTTCQHILYSCHAWVTKFEEAQQSMMSHLSSVQSRARLVKDDQSFIDDNEPVIKKGLFQSKTNFSTQGQSTKIDECSDCMICLERLDSSSRKLEVCGHRFHQSCIKKWFESSGKHSCPTCGHLYGISKGPQPSNGKMTTNRISIRLPGFEYEKYGYKEEPTIEIVYIFPSGVQGPLNPYPGRPFTGTTRKAYLPNNEEGKNILRLLERAFNDQHVFTIGRSSTTGQDNVVTWNDIHHKTSITGGPQHFGYPDPTYLLRVRQELADKGYT